MYFIFAYIWNKIEKKNKLEVKKKNRTCIIGDQRLEYIQKKNSCA